ncbi:aminotransferase class V-fold PLP-dependent enzyme [Devosia sp. 2618]|uniref:aminotransferase class V-fold PLP-dependent enzyme n=1 Tax=Devosia sp. 2618 TaxID=3156454 RepID=UPI00339646ED
MTASRPVLANNSALLCGSPELRALFPAVAETTYLSICDKMILADPIRQGVDRFLDHLTHASTNRVGHEEKVTSSRRLFAEMVGATPDEIAVTRNVSDGLNSVATAFPFAEGDNVLLALGAEHPNNIYPWLHQQRRGIELRNVRGVAGRIDVDAMIAAMDSRTRLVSVASVSFAPGERTDITALGTECRKRGIFLLVDGVQSAGILHHDFSNEPIDGFATSTSKGLLGLYGYGFLYVKRNWLDRLMPVHMSRTGADAENDDASAMGTYDYRPRPDAGRFELGSYNLAGAYAAEASLTMLLELGTRAIEAHVLELADELRDGLNRLGLPVFAPRLPSHVITLGEVDAGGHGYSADPRMTRCHEVLTEAGVVSTLRRGQLRMGLHCYNNRSDIDTVLEVLQDARRIAGH